MNLFLVCSIICLASCASGKFIKKIDVNNDGFYEKYQVFYNDKLIKENYDKDQDGDIDSVIYYDKKGVVSKINDSS